MCVFLSLEVQESWSASQILPYQLYHFYLRHMQCPDKLGEKKGGCSNKGKRQYLFEESRRRRRRRINLSWTPLQTNPPPPSIRVSGYVSEPSEHLSSCPPLPHTDKLLSWQQNQTFLESTTSRNNRTLQCSRFAGVSAPTVCRSVLKNSDWKCFSQSLAEPIRVLWAEGGRLYCKFASL